jgi:uncharacterized repeat protein (TIGR03833 family)
MNGQHRQSIRPGVEVTIVLKKDQSSGKLTRGVVADVLTNSSFHPHGIKVRLVSGDVGRVQEVLTADEAQRDEAAKPV